MSLNGSMKNAPEKNPPRKNAPQENSPLPPYSRKIAAMKFFCDFFLITSFYFY